MTFMVDGKLRYYTKSRVRPILVGDIVSVSLLPTSLPEAFACEPAIDRVEAYSISRDSVYLEISGEILINRITPADDSGIKFYAKNVIMKDRFCLNG